MNAARNTPPDLTFEGGDLPVNAELIERRLTEIWQQLSTDRPDQFPAIKLCLANLIVVTDPDNRAQAERLAAEIAAMHPSRIILIVTDDTRRAYSALVSTSCTRDTETGTVRCWEIIQIFSDKEHTTDIPGAIRSLLIDSVPVISVDFRPFQTTPEFDRTVLYLSDYQVVNAEVVPSRVSRQTSLSLRWYWTLPLRELLSELFSGIISSGKSARLSAITFYSHANRDNYDDLMSGWILHRIQGGTVLATDKEYVVDCPGHCVRFKWEDIDESSDKLLALQFDDGLSAVVTVRIPDDCSDAFYVGAHGTLRLEKRLSSYALSRYLIGILQDDTEFQEYIVSCKSARRIIQPEFR
jgi:hypothetical protein